MLYASAWKELVEAQWESGVVPGPFYHPDEEKGLQHHEKQDHEKQDHEKQDHEKQDHEKQDYVFRECYHTTLVSCLAGALCPWQG